VPTYRRLPRFIKDHKKLSPSQRQEFRAAVELFVQSLREERGRFPRQLRIHRIDSTDDVWSLTWGKNGNGRATFQYGTSPHQGEPHVIWRRVTSDHSLYREP
jgi:hypothetical protein